MYPFKFKVIGSFFLYILIIGIVACGGSSGVIEEAPAAEAPAAEPIELVLLIPAGLAGNDLQQAIENVQVKISEEYEPVHLSVEHYQTPLDDCPLCGCQGVPVPDLDIYDPDIFLGYSQVAQHVFEQYDLDPVPEYIIESVHPFESSNNAYTSQATGEMVGLAQATAPLMLISKPDMLGGLSTIQQADSFASASIDNGATIMVPADSSVALAIGQSVLGDEFDVNELFDGNIGGMAMKVFESAPVLSEFINSGFVQTAGPNEIIAAFHSGEASSALFNSTLLSALAESGYTGELQVSPVPSINHQGGSTHMLGWMVPVQEEEGLDTSLAWEVTRALIEEPAMVELMLSFGSLPASESGFNVMANSTDEIVEKNLMPSAVLADEQFGQLARIANESKAWQVPSRFAIEPFNMFLMPVADGFVANIINGEDFLEAANTLQLTQEQFLKEQP